MNNKIKKDLVNKILKLSKIQQNEVFNIIKNEGINYSSNNNGIFINLTKIDIDLISKINVYIDYLKSNQENLNRIEDYYNTITMYNENEKKLYKIVNFDEYINLQNTKFLENIKNYLNLKKKKEINSKFINTIKKYQRLLFLNYEHDNLNDLSKENYLIKN